MAKGYRLLFLSLRKPDRIDDCYCSNHMIAWALWSAFQDLNHVALSYRDCNTVWNEPPEADAMLVHAYFGNEVFGQVAAGHYAGVRHKMQIGEHPAIGFDRRYTFLPCSDCTYFPCPCLKAVTAQYPAAGAKGSVLLDHIWCEHREWTKRLYSWLANYPFPIGQLRRSIIDPERPEEANYDDNWPYPEQIKLISESGYRDYLRLTAPYETFIVTHPGSYEHSVVDMAARGMRVLVPIQDGRPFLQPDLIRHLDLSTFATCDEFLSLLRQPHQPTGGLLARMTDISEIVATIDADCQEALG